MSSTRRNAGCTALSIIDVIGNVNLSETGCKSHTLNLMEHRFGFLQPGQAIILVNRQHNRARMMYCLMDRTRSLVLAENDVDCVVWTEPYTVIANFLAWAAQFLRDRAAVKHWRKAMNDLNAHKIVHEQLGRMGRRRRRSQTTLPPEAAQPHPYSVLSGEIFKPTGISITNIVGAEAAAHAPRQVKRYHTYHE
jgi:hypothetical protein